MSEMPYSERLKNIARDPLWWIKLLSMVGVVVINLVRGPYWLASAFWCVFGLAFIASAIRGKEMGLDRPMTSYERRVSAVVGILVTALFAITLVVKL